MSSAAAAVAQTRCPRRGGRQRGDGAAQRPADPQLRGPEAHRSVDHQFDLRPDGDDDLFPADFFSSFEAPPAATVAVWACCSSNSRRAPSMGGAGLRQARVSPVAAMTLREAEKVRRPRMRLKKLDVREIIWSAASNSDGPRLLRLRGRCADVRLCCCLTLSGSTRK